MAGWPEGWRERVLRQTGVPKTQFALDVLSAWRQSTPTEPWTNNPLGMPARGSNVPRALDTQYGAFVTINAFADAFKHAMKLPQNQNLVHVLIAADSLTAAWREIHGLGWPANATETDYPAVLLDMVEQAFRDKINAVAKRERKTAGTQLASPAQHADIRSQGYALHHAAKHFADGKKAIDFIVRRLS
jgi:hypothetical protein